MRKHEPKRQNSPVSANLWQTRLMTADDIQGALADITAKTARRSQPRASEIALPHAVWHGIAQSGIDGGVTSQGKAANSALTR